MSDDIMQAKDLNFYAN